MADNEFLLICSALTDKRGIDWRALLDLPLLGPILSGLGQTEQNPLHHGEGNALIHTQRVCEALQSLPEYEAADEKTALTLLLAALLHDVGKLRTTKTEQGCLVSPGHARVGALMARELLWLAGLSGSAEGQSLREAVCSLVRYHTIPPYAMKDEGIERRIVGLASQGELAAGFTVKNLCILERADVLGRVCPDREDYLDRIEYCALLAEELGCLDAPYPFSDPYSERAYFKGRTAFAGQSLFNESRCRVIMLSGLPGTGKDTWIEKNHPDLPMISLDNIRRELGILPTDDQGRVIAEATERMRALLREGRDFVYNATSLISQIRHKWIDLFEAYGASVELTFLECDLKCALERNAGRSGVAVVPEQVIRSMLSKLEVPERVEAEEVKWLIS